MKSKYKRRGIPVEHRVLVNAIAALEDADIYGCFWCQTELRDGFTHWDHVHPVSRMGVHYAGNVVWTCERCNQNKKARPTYAWARDRVLRLFGIELPKGPDRWSPTELEGWTSAKVEEWNAEPS